MKKYTATLLLLVSSGCGLAPHNDMPGAYTPLYVPPVCGTSGVITKDDGTSTPCVSARILTTTQPDGTQIWKATGINSGVMTCTNADSQLYYSNSNLVISKICDTTNTTCCDFTPAAQAARF